MNGVSRLQAITIVLTDEQTALMRRYQQLLSEWNSKVNLVSRKLSVEDLWQHIEHCLALALRGFPDGTRVVDWGAGGGLPTVPLAIVFPRVRFTAIDATRKKIDAVNDMVQQLGLTNVVAMHTRAEEWKGQAEYSVSRATAPLATLWSWHAAVASGDGGGAGGANDETWPKGLLALKGGDLTNELVDLSKIAPGARAAVTDLEPTLGPSYAGKVIVSVTGTAGPGLGRDRSRDGSRGRSKARGRQSGRRRGRGHNR